MLARLKVWLEETHGPDFELVRHFLLRFFDTELTSIPGEWQKVAAGIFAVLFSISILMVQSYMERYDKLQAAGFSADAIYREMGADQMLFLGLTMAATAVLTVLQWQSLFPSLRDCLAMAGLPVTPRQVFVAKSAALLVVFTAFVLA